MDDFEKWWNALEGYPQTGGLKLAARAAYEAGQASRKPDGHPWVKGQCPMGCGETLFVGAGSYITCSYIPCPNPTAVADAMDGLSAAQKVIEAAEGFVDEIESYEALVALESALADYRAVTKDDLTPSSPKDSSDTTSSGSALQGGEK